jgi:hypothetical protein
MGFELLPLLMIGLPLLAVPVIIHLINLLRHRRVPWAAMEFLLASHKKSSTWVILKQLLLLLLRMVAIAAVAAILAQPLLRDFRLGGDTTHHIVLLDDTYSMSDTRGNQSVFDVAKNEVLAIGTQAAGRSGQRFTLLRFSQAPRLQSSLGGATAPAAGESRSATSIEYFDRPVERDFAAALADRLGRISPTQRATSPQEALEALARLLQSDRAEKRIVYLVSDFRARHWEGESGRAAGELLEQLMQHDATQVQLVHCVNEHHANLTIADLEVRSGMRSAGIPIEMEVKIANHGPAPLRDVTVYVQEDDRPPTSLILDQVPTHEPATRRFTVKFATAGEHRVTVRLEPDAVAADNARHLVVNVPVTMPVLMLDGDAGAPGCDSSFLQAVFDPDPGTFRTGLSPQVELPRWLNDPSRDLSRYSAIYLFNFDRLEPPAIAALEQYVRQGGGLAVFVGERTRGKFVNDHLHRDGQGFFPVRLAELPVDLLVDRLVRAPDIAPDTEHPVFSVFRGQDNKFLNDVTVARYFPLAPSWQIPQDVPVKVVARLRNGQPLALEHRYGEGRVFVLLTTAAPVWNNWARNPSFVVAALELQSYLSHLADPVYQVGTPIVAQVPAGAYKLQATVRRMEAGTEVGIEAAGEDPLTFAFDETDEADIYQLVLEPEQGGVEIRQFAYNIQPDEGQLNFVPLDRLTSLLGGNARVTARMAGGSAAGTAGLEPGKSPLSQYLLYALIMLLVGEQILAYSASYHPPAAGGDRK